MEKCVRRKCVDVELQEARLYEGRRAVMWKVVLKVAETCKEEVER